MVKHRGIRAALLSCAATALIGTAPAPAFDPNPYLHAQRLVDIGGRKMNLYCTGKGSPTVVLDAGANDTTLAWRFVQPAIAKRTRVCSYDRAGLGFSEPAPPPRDARAAVHDLHALLQRAGIAPPYILVAHSLAGLYAPLYADSHEADVAGMVLVDPGVPYQLKRMAAAAPGLAPLLAALPAWDRMCASAAASRQMHAGSTADAQCSTPADPSLPAALNALIARQWQRPGTWADFVSADEASGTTSSDEVVHAQRSLGAMPLVVLSERGFIRDFASLPATQQRALLDASKAWHDRIAALSSRGVDLMIGGAGHDIQIDRPASVISAIAKVVDETHRYVSTSLRRSASRAHATSMAMRSPTETSRPHRYDE
jgi:pimeloyl-ACP methyl ester carboxylesterase